MRYLIVDGIVISLLIGFALGLTSKCGPNSLCTCEWPLNIVNCSYADITVKQLDLVLSSSENVSTLLLDGNIFPEFNVSDFGRFVNLTKLSLRRCNISKIHSPGELNPLPQLQNLDLSENNITELSSRSFIPNTLHYLYLSKNEISEISGDALAGLATSSISILDLSDNKLKSFPKFDGVQQSHLYSLNLSGNNLSAYLDNITLAENLFQRLKSVKELDLSRNRIKELHHFLLADMTNLQKLDLSYNEIEDLDQISLKSDEHKVVTFNHWGRDSPIFWFPHGLFSLEYINLSHNKIKVLDVTIFSIENLPSLKNIDLGFNNLVCNAENFMFFEAFINVKAKSAGCHKNKSETCISFPRNSFPKNFHIINVDSRDRSSGYYCTEAATSKEYHVFDFQCIDACRADYVKLLPMYQNWKQDQELLHTEPSMLSSGFTISITLAVLTVICLTLLFFCHKLDLWRRITGQMRYVQVRRNLLQLEGGDDAVI